MRRAVLTFLLLATATWACEQAPTGPGSARETVPANHPTANITDQSKTAAGFHENRIAYDWTVEKTASPTDIVVEPGTSETVTIDVDATRSEVSNVTVFGVRGEICATNDDEAATEGLEIEDVVQINTPGPGGFENHASTTIVPAEQIPAGETRCYDYEVEFAPGVAGSEYRNQAKITITNHESGTKVSQTDQVAFTLPADPTVITEDAEADAEDDATCPAGFTCTPTDTGDGTGPWNFPDTGAISFDVVIENVSASCDLNFVYEDTVTLTESDTGVERTDGASVDIYTGECPDACTLSHGYWKTHAGFHGNNADRVSPFLPITLGSGGGSSVVISTAAEAVAALEFYGQASNGINKLYGQLLAAKLNIANGADGSAVAATIAAADAFLAANDSNAWSSLTKADKQLVNGWMGTLELYNTGGIGPGACP